MIDIDFSKIKLIIWDLDDTFWRGTLSEGPVKPIYQNISLVKDLTEHGIVNSICSKNDFQPVHDRLKEMGVDNYFVFNSIDWTPKGPRISQLIKDMNLRPANCLFIDDNKVNLNEAKYYEQELMIASPDIIPSLEAYVTKTTVTDSNCQRLKNYQLLVQKQLAKISSVDNMEFLYNSNTKVEIHRDCLFHLTRIHELILRTNQLNYTKQRSSYEELEKICNDDTIDTGYVTVSDRFGDYGIVGFFAVKNNHCIHFLFSCRTIGQGVEQYVYAMLGHPELEVKGEVINPVTYDVAPGWINQKRLNKCIINTEKINAKIILKGACDLSAMSEYLRTDSLIEEFTFMGRTRGNNQEHYNHSTNYLQWPFLSDDIKQELLNECVFNDEEMFHTAIYDDDVSLIFLSTMIEPNLGIYRRKKDGLRIAFGEYIYPLTAPENWELYINQKIFTARNYFTREWLKKFSESYEYEGRLSPAQIVENAKELLKKVGTQTKVCYILGSETPFLKNCQRNYEDRHLLYKDINGRFRQLAKENNRVLLIDVNDYINGQEDFNNNINHFQRRIYFEMAKMANEIINQIVGSKVEQKSKFYLWRKSLIDIIGYTGFYQTPIWALIRKPYTYIKKI